MSDVVLDANTRTRWVDKHPGILALLETTRQAGGAAHVPTVCLVAAIYGRAADAPFSQRIEGCQLRQPSQQFATPRCDRCPAHGNPPIAVANPEV